MAEMPTRDELLEQSNALIEKAKALTSKEDAGAEDFTNARAMIEDAKELKERCKTLAELETMANEKAKEAEAKGKERKDKSPFNTLGEYLYAIWKASKFHELDGRLKFVRMRDDPAPEFNPQNKGWVESKDLVENTGADGGFLVFPEFRADLFMLTEFQRYVRERALVVPMRARQVQVPVLDQTGTTSGQSNIYGGVVPKWTEEAKEKDESDPEFRQFGLVAHKLVVYTEVSDELLADSAIGLEALLRRLMGGAISNEEEYTFIQGTGAGQPLGIVDANCNVTLRVARQTANQINVQDILNMLSEFMGQKPIWLAHQSTMPQLLALNGPAGNPSYVWISNLRDGPPARLMGYPVYFTENNPTLGSEGDIALCDWSKYVIGDRQTLTIDNSMHYRFRYDLTAWRAVHRVGGRPWLSQPLTLRDGTTQVSPFVILDDAVAS